MDEAEQYKQAYLREKKARKEAEKLLTVKTRETYDNFIKINEQYEQLSLQTKELQLLVEVAQAVESASSTTTLIGIFFKSVCRLLHSPYGIVYFTNKESNTLSSSDIRYPEGDNFPKEITTLVKGSSYHAGKSIPGRVLQEGKKVLWNTDQAFEGTEERCETLGKLGLHGVLAIPIKVFNSVIAVTEFGVEDTDSLKASSLEKVEAAAIQLQLALERKKSEFKLAHNYKQLEKAHTKLVNTQKQLVHSEKMGSLGQIAAGVAHEINNPIGFVLSNMSTLKEYKDVLVQLIKLYQSLDDPEIKRDDTLAAIQQLSEEEDIEYVFEDIDCLIDDSQEGLVRVRDIVKSLNSFARTDSGERHYHDLEECLEKTIKILWNEIKFKIELERDYQPCPKVLCSSGQLIQVFVNLIANAAHACGERGKIKISLFYQAQYAIIKIADNGSGISQENISKIFDPFFTTKAVGKGTGLGLSVSIGIIESHEGKIKVDSEIGEGTTFTIQLPIKKL